MQCALRFLSVFVLNFYPFTTVIHNKWSPSCIDASILYTVVTNRAISNCHFEGFHLESVPCRPEVDVYKRQLLNTVKFNH